MDEPIAIVNANGEAVLKSTLDKYAVKTDEQNYEDTEDYFLNKVSRKGANKGLEDSKQAPEGESYYGAYGLKQPLMNPKLLSSLYRVNTYHARSIKAQSTDIGGIGCYVEPVMKDVNKSHIEDVENFIQNCKPFIEEIITNAVNDRIQTGYLCMEVIREGGVSSGKPKRLEQIPSPTVRIHSSKNKFMMTWDGITKKWFKRPGYDKDVDVTTGDEYPLGSLLPEQAANDLLFAVNYTSQSTYYGLPDYVPVIPTMIGDKAAVSYNIVFFKNFGVPAYAIFISGYFEDEPAKDADGNPIPGKTKLQLLIEEKFKEVINNPHSNMVFMIPTGAADVKVEIRFEKLSVDTKEGHFRLYRQDNRDEVIAAHGMDPHQLGVRVSGALGGDTAKQSDRNYKNRIIIPEQRKITSLINSILIWDENTGFGYTDCQIKLKVIDTDDQQVEFDIDSKMLDKASARPVDLIKKWASKRGFEIPEDIEKNPYLTAYYLDGQPLDPELSLTKSEEQSNLPGEVAKILDDVADKLDPAPSNLIRRFISG